MDKAKFEEWTKQINEMLQTARKEAGDGPRSLIEAVQVLAELVRELGKQVYSG